MSFKDVITKAEINSEEQQMRMNIHKQNCCVPLSSYEEIGYLHGVILKKENGVDRTVIEFTPKNNNKIAISTNQSVAYFENVIDREVFLSGLINQESNKPILYVSSCYSVDDRDDKLNECSSMSEEEKRAFYSKIQELSPQLQKDLIEKRVKLVGHELENSHEEMPSYVNEEEMDALFSVLEPAIPQAFRTEYYNCKRMLRAPGSPAERKNYIKVISHILRIDWINQHYTKIDVSKAMNYLHSHHVGHTAQLEELRTLFLSANYTEKAPKTLFFCGRSAGTSSLATAVAKAINKKYVELDLTGRDAKDPEYISGSGRLYENGQPGCIFESIVNMGGPNGLLIIKDIDMIDPDLIRALQKLIEKNTYVDGFMQAPLDLSNMWLICTASSKEEIPRSLLESAHEMIFEPLSEDERIDAINRVMLKEKCKDYGISCNVVLPTDVCKTLIYECSHNSNKKLATNLESLAIKILAEGKKEFPAFDKKMLNDYFCLEDTWKIKDEYVTTQAEIEKKYYRLHELYPCNQRMDELLDDIYNGDQKEYALRAMRVLANVTNGFPCEDTPAEIDERLKKFRGCGQNHLISEVEDAFLGEKLMGGTGTKRMTVLGLYGPPGVGKSSFAEVIAKSLGRNMIKLSFAGASDPSKLQGRNKSIPNAGPSELLCELAKAKGVYNDVICIDEVDKAQDGALQALHEFLDPNPDSHWYDEFCQTTLPKNNFIVIVTFNDISKLPRSIIDRMHLIAVEGYTLSQKKEIAKNSVLKKYSDQMGLENVSISDDALDLLVHNYSVTPGIRDLEMDIEKILLRKINKKEQSLDIRIEECDVRNILGRKRTSGLNDFGNEKPIPGQVIGLAVARGIGSCIAVQVLEDFKPNGENNLTGLLTGSCLESFYDAKFYASRVLKKTLGKDMPNVRCSFRNPGISKDGPSAGVTFFMAIMSCVLGRSLPKNVAFTGTIDLYGNIGEVDCMAKLIAAEREGLTAYIPQDSYNSLKEENRLDQLNANIIPVSHVRELIKIFFGLEVKDDEQEAYEY